MTRPALALLTAALLAAGAGATGIVPASATPTTFHIRRNVESFEAGAGTHACSEPYLTTDDFFSDTFSGDLQSGTEQDNSDVVHSYWAAPDLIGAQTEVPNFWATTYLPVSDVDTLGSVFSPRGGGVLFGVLMHNATGTITVIGYANANFDQGYYDEDWTDPFYEWSWEVNGVSQPTGTWDAFVADHPHLAVERIVVSPRSGCESGAGAHVDSISAGPAGSETVWDYDIDQVGTSITGLGRTPTVVAGRTSYMLRWNLRADNDDAINGTLPVTIQSVRYDQARWQSVFTGATGPSGTTKKKFSPLYNTDYRVVYRGSGDGYYGPSTSATDHVKVAPDVRISLDRDRVRRGGDVTASGRVVPAKPGKTITLWRYPPPDQSTPENVNGVRFARVTLDGDSHYSRTFSTAGWERVRWIILGKIARTTGNTAGKSYVWDTVTVR